MSSTNTMNNDGNDIIVPILIPFSHHMGIDISLSTLHEDGYYL